MVFDYQSFSNILFVLSLGQSVLPFIFHSVLYAKFPLPNFAISKLFPFLLRSSKKIKPYYQFCIELQKTI